VFIEFDFDVALCYFNQVIRGHEVLMEQQQIDDISIVGELRKALGSEAGAVAEFLLLLQRLDADRGWARLGYASLFDFCHLNLNLTRAEAYSRTRLVRLVGEVPRVILFLKSGEVSLSALRILAPILTPQNFDEVFAFVRGKSTREIEDYRNTFRVHDKPSMRGVVRAVYSPVEIASQQASSGQLFSPVHASDGAVAADKRVAVAPVLGVNSKVNENSAGEGADSEECFPCMQKTVRMSVTLSEQQWEKYRRACNLSNHSPTGGDVAEVMEMLLDLYLKRHEGKLAKSQKEAVSRDETKACVDKKSVEESQLEASASLTSPEREFPETRRGRYIPQNIRREVRERDGNRCTFVSDVTGQRCECERGLQFDHIKPFAFGGESNTAQNLRLLCPAHNRLAAENVFGTEFMSRKVHAASANSAV
jgi:hypothetical protein